MNIYLKMNVYKWDVAYETIGTSFSVEELNETNLVDKISEDWKRPNMKLEVKNLNITDNRATCDLFYNDIEPKLVSNNISKRINRFIKK
jgi:hypothetical protein